MAELYETNEAAPRRAVLVGIRYPKDSGFERSMNELEGLAEACDLEVAAIFEQARERADSAYAIGRGKLDEINLAAQQEEADLVIFNNTLSPAQLSNLSSALEVEVLDRTTLILNIFAERARTREAMMQVDFARLKYMLPRLVGLRTNLSRQAGSSGGSLSNKGAGEKKIELDRRAIEKRMDHLRSELKEVDRIRETQTKRRIKSGVPLVSLVGYTNAGKSTLMNLLLDSFGSPDDKKVMSEDMLFATLDTSVRRIEAPNTRPFLLSDTVGFIADLPTQLVQAFRSTLKEALSADLLLEVIDSSDPEYDKQVEVTERTLQELGAGDVPVIRVMNKSDLVPQESGSLQPISISYRDAVYISAKSGEGLEALMQAISEQLDSGRRRVTLLIPYDKASLEARLRSDATVLEVEYLGEGIKMTALIDRARLHEYSEYTLSE